MKATVFQGENDVNVEEVEKPEIEDSEDALIRVTHTCVCGSDLWHYRGYSDLVPGSRIGHEPAGVVEEVGEEVEYDNGYDEEALRPVECVSCGKVNSPVQDICSECGNPLTEQEKNSVSRITT